MQPPRRVHGSIPQRDATTGLDVALTGHDQNAPDPIYDPRLCVEAIAFAADHLWREVWVGNSTAVRAFAQSIVPCVADRQVAGFKDAQLGAPMLSRTGNLDEPIAGSAAIDGRFTDRVRFASGQF